MGIMTFAIALAAAATQPPDPATVQMPDMTPTRDARVIANGWVHFYFHKDGVTYEQAYADFADCYRFISPSQLIVELPVFVPWGNGPGNEPATSAARNSGMAGGLIGALFSGSIERRAWQSRMRRCMEPRGYVRYPLAPDSWRQLIDGHSARAVAMQALAASGPNPNLPVVTR